MGSQAFRYFNQLGHLSLQPLQMSIQLLIKFSTSLGVSNGFFLVCLRFLVLEKSGTEKHPNKVITSEKKKKPDLLPHTFD